MIKLSNLGPSYYTIKKRFKRVDDIMKHDGLYVSLNYDKKLLNETKEIYGLIYIPPLFKSEIGNFTLNKKVSTHPLTENDLLPPGPQVSWFCIYPKFRGKEYSTIIYEGLINKYGALYSDYEQTVGGTKIWINLLKRKNVDIYQISWKKTDLTIATIKKYTYVHDKQCFIDWLNNNKTFGIDTILLAVPKNTEIKEIHD